MIANTEYLRKLKKQRSNLKAKIKSCREKGKDTTDLEKELDDVLQGFHDAGYVVWSQYSSRFPEPPPGWNNKSMTLLSTTKGVTNTVTETTKQSIKELPEKTCSRKDSTYVLNIAWTETDKGTDADTLSKLDEYLKSVAEADIYDDSCDSSEEGFEIEHIIKYKYKTSRQVFDVIKTSAGFLIDKLQDQTKDGIEYYGKCLDGEGRN